MLLANRRKAENTTMVMGLVALATMIATNGALASAQVAYTVFPAVQTQDGTGHQPTSAGTNAKVTLTVKDSTVGYVINTLAQQAHLQTYYTRTPALAKRISVQLANVRVMDAFAIVLKGTGLTARIAADGETVVLRDQTPSPLAGNRLASGSIAGRVTDSASGAGLGGVSVKIEGTKLSTVTSDSGHFTLRDVPTGDQVLTVRLFGYKPAERTVTVVDSERTTLRIVMVSVPTVLSGVVTTATGLQRKIELGNDITTLNVDSIMQSAPVSSVTDLLETRVPGLTVMHSSGEPGAPSRLRLRGIGSISGNNDPVIIIDGIRVYSSQSDPRNNNLAPSARLTGYGVALSSSRSADNTQFSAPSPIDQIDPNSIETIEVFKGPSASALYGSDAANGVIVITTKHGRAGPTHWSLNLGQGVNWIPGSWPTNTFRFGTNVLGKGPVCNWYDPTCVVVDSLRTYQALNDPQYTVLSHGGDQNASLTISGGVPTLQYSVSGTGSGTSGNLKLPAVEQQQYEAVYGPIPGWMVRPDQLTTWGVNGAITALPYQTLHAVLQSSLFNSAQQTSSLQGAIPQLEGAYISGGIETYADGTSYPLSTVPLINNYVERVTDAAMTTKNTLTLSWQPRTWLPTITTSGGLQTTQRTDQSYIPYGISSAVTNGCGRLTATVCVQNTDTTGYYGLGRGLSHNQTLTVGTEIPLFRQHLSLALGGNDFSETTNDFSVYTDQLAPGISDPQIFLTSVPCSADNSAACPQQNSSSSSTYGWYFEPRLNLSSRFFVAPGFRLDGGSGGTHSTNTSGGTTGGVSAFPKLDLSYLAVDRQGSRPMWGFLTLLRPRVAFGLAGTQPAAQDRLRVFNLSTGADPGGEGSLVQGVNCAGIVTLNGTSVPAVCLSSLGNTQLRPERSSELEGGLDATLWNGRFTLTVTQYNKTRKDAIITIPVAPSVSQPGGSQFSIAENIGEVRNTGTELTMNATIVDSRALSWNVGANLSNDNNLLVHLNRGQQVNYNLGLVPGYPLFGQWVAPIVSFVDFNHDGIIEGNEVKLGDSLVYEGQPNPKYQLNVNTSLHLLNGRLGVYATFAYQNGMTQNNQAALTSAAFYTLGNNPNTPLAYQAAVQAANCAASGGIVSQGVQSCSDYGFIQTVNTLRFQDLSINYELPRQVSSWFRVPRMTMMVQGSNLGLHSNYRGIDPDVNAFSTVSSVDQTADFGQIPEPRTWWFKLTLGN